MSRSTARTSVHLTRGLLSVALLTAALGLPSSAAAAEKPSATVSAPWVKTKKVSGKHTKVAVSVTLKGQGPFTWEGHGSVEASAYGKIDSWTGAAPLAAGTHHLELSSTKFFDTAGRQNISLTFTDATGAEVEVQSSVHVIDTNRPASITGASGSVTAAKKRTLRGKAAPVGPMKAPYRVYFRAPGKKKFTAIGRVTPDQNSQWKLRSTRIRPGTYVVKAESKYLTSTTSRKFTVKASAFSG